MRDISAELALHMHQLRQHGDMQPAIVQAQFMALLLLIVADHLAENPMTADARSDLITFVEVNVAELDWISPGYAALFRRITLDPAPPMPRLTK